MERCGCEGFVVGGSAEDITAKGGQDDSRCESRYDECECGWFRGSHNGEELIGAQGKRCTVGGFRLGRRFVPGVNLSIDQRGKQVCEKCKGLVRPSDGVKGSVICGCAEEEAMKREEEVWEREKQEREKQEARAQELINQIRKLNSENEAKQHSADLAQGMEKMIQMEQRLTKLEWAMHTASQLNRAEQPDAWWHDQAKAQAEMDARVKEQQEARLSSPYTDDNNPPPTSQFTPKSAEPAPRYDLIPAYALRLLAEVFGEGERKYPGCAINSTTIHHLLAEHNIGWWTDRQNHAQEHYYRYHQGDRTESHLAKVMWYCAVRLAVDRLEQEQD